MSATRASTPRTSLPERDKASAGKVAESAKTKGKMAAAKGKEASNPPTDGAININTAKEEDLDQL